MNKLKFNYKPNSKTKPGKIPVIRIITKEHSIYPIFFNKYGIKKTDDEIKKEIEKVVQPNK